MASAITLWLPAPPDNANGRAHWAAANRAKKAYWQQLALRRAAALLPPPPRAPLPAARLGVLWVNRSAAHTKDTDNLVRRLKPVCDWLVGHGYVAGDTPRHLKWDEPEQAVGVPTPALCSVRLTLTPLPDRP